MQGPFLPRGLAFGVSYLEIDACAMTDRQAKRLKDAMDFM